MSSKVFDNFASSVADVHDDATLMMNCLLGPGGVPQNLILALRDQGASNLTVYPCANFGWVGGFRKLEGQKAYVTPAVLVENHQVRKAVVTWGKGDEKFLNVLEVAAQAGEVEVEFLPLGVYAQKVLVAGHGIPGFYSPIGVGTVYETGKEKRVINGREYIFELPIRADFGFVRAYKGDTMGNLIYRGTSRLFNPLIAKASDVTIAEVEHLVEPGEIAADEIVTPGVFVDRIVQIREGDWK